MKARTMQNDDQDSTQFASETLMRDINNIATSVFDDDLDAFDYDDDFDQCFFTARAMK